MKKQRKLNIKIRDLLKNVTGGRRHQPHRHRVVFGAAPVGWIPNPTGAGKWDYHRWTAIASLTRKGLLKAAAAPCAV